MTITNQTRYEDLLVYWRRPDPNGPLVVRASLSEVVEQVDDSTSPPTITPMRHILAASVNTADVAAMVGANLGPLTDQVASLTADLATAQADAATKGAALDAANAQVTALQAQIAMLTAPPAVREVQSYRFKAALRQFPSPAGSPAGIVTMRDAVDAARATWPAEDQDAWDAPQFLRNDPRLNALAANFTGGDAAAAQALLDQIFDAADRVA